MPSVLDRVRSGPEPQPPLVILSWPGDALEEQVRRFIDLGAVVVIVSEAEEHRWLAPVLSHPSGAADATAPFSVDERSHCARWGDRRLTLTELELRLLSELAGDPHVSRSFAELRIAGWGDGVPLASDRHMVRSAIQRIRQKLCGAGAPVVIESVRGHGFQLVPVSR